MSYTLIRRGFEEKLLAIAGIPDIAFENVIYVPTLGTEYVRAKMVNTTAPLATLGVNGQQVYRGRFLVDVFYPKAEGPRAAESMAETIASDFQVGTNFAATGITNRIHIRRSEIPRGALEDRHWFQVNVTIEWYVYI